MKRLATASILIFLIASGLTGLAQSSAEYLRPKGDETGLFESFWAPMRQVQIAATAMGHAREGASLQAGQFVVAASGQRIWTPLSAGTMALPDGASFMGGSQVPTILGGQSEEVLQFVALNSITNEYRTVREFHAPAGVNRRSFDFYRVEAAVGVGLGLEIQGRVFLPQATGQWASGGFGLGFHIEGKQVIRALEFLPVDLSFQLHYNQLRTGWDLPYAVLEGTGQNLPPNPLPQESRLTNHQGLAQLLISRDFGPVTPFVALGISRNESILEVTGDFPFTTFFVNEQTGAEVLSATSIRNPYYGLNGSFVPHLETGLSARLSLLHLRASWLWGSYHGLTLSAGVFLGKSYEK